MKKVLSIKYKVSRSSGFTLIELMVVVAIIAILVAIVLPGLGQFDSYQALQDAASKLQSDLRTTQNNASSGLKCGASTNQRATGWSLNITSSNQYILQPDCSDGSHLPQTTRALINGVTISQVFMDEGDGASTTSVCLNSGVSFSNISGKVNFSPGTVLYNQDSHTRMGIVLAAGTQQSTVFAEQGGAIYVNNSLPSSPVTPNPVCAPTATPTPTTAVPFIASSSYNATANAVVTVSWGNIPLRSADPTKNYINLVASDGTKSAPIYTDSCSATAGTSAPPAAGSCPYALPGTSGIWNFRISTFDATNGTSYNSPSITVIVPGATNTPTPTLTPTPPVGSPTPTPATSYAAANPTSIGVGGNVTVNWANISSQADNTSYIILLTSTNQFASSQIYTNTCSGTAGSTAPPTTGSCATTLPSSATAGQYYFQYVLRFGGTAFSYINTPSITIF